MMEMSTWYFDYVNFNATGFRPYITTLYAVFLGCVRKTISRVLVLVVSMGFGVVLPYLGAIQNKVRTFSPAPPMHHQELVDRSPAICSAKEGLLQHCGRRNSTKLSLRCLAAWALVKHQLHVVQEQHLPGHLGQPSRSPLPS